MDWPAAAALIGAIFGASLPLSVAIFRFMPMRGKAMAEEMRQEMTPALAEQLGDIQEDVGKLKLDVRTLEGDQKRTGLDITELRRELSELRRWLTENVFKSHG